MNEPTHAKAERIDLLDYARFVAAVAVALYHYTDFGIRYNRVPFHMALPVLTEIGKYGYLGVELFFMISGFVIFNSAKGRTAAQFAVARALRLYPAFLVCVILTSLAIHFWGAPAYRVHLTQFVMNLSMIPNTFGQANVDGSYWTLVVELKFYIVIFLLMLIGFSRKLEYFFLAWPVLMILTSVAGFQPPELLKGYDSYFCAGALFAISRGKKNIVLNILLLICLYYSLQLSVIKNLEVRDLHPMSPLVAAALVFSFYLFFWVLNRTAMTGLKLPFARQIGGTTYPLYLIHQTVGYIIIGHFANEQNKAYVVTATIIAMIFTGFLLHVYAEQNTQNLWKLTFRRIIGMPVTWLENLFSGLWLRFKRAV